MIAGQHATACASACQHFSRSMRSKTAARQACYSIVSDTTLSPASLSGTQ
jgi:hypothetical protein